MPQSSQTRAVQAFTCLGSNCEDTCCVGWGMQVAPPTVERYRAEAPALLDAIEPVDGGYVMKRDPATDYCVKFDAGWCGIHRDYGTDFLGDACHFFPRITRALGEQVFTAATLSCPEIARLTLYADDPFTRSTLEEMRVPYSLTQYLPPGMSSEAAFTIHDRFVSEAANPAHSAEINLMRCLTVAHSLQTQPVDQWEGASGFYFRMAESRIPAAAAVPEDLFNLTLALHGLMQAGHAARARLVAIRDCIAAVLGITFHDAGQIATAPDATIQALRMVRHWETVAQSTMQPVLTRYLQAQLSAALFPFAGLGATPAERMTIIGVRFATVKLALMAQAMQQQSVPDSASVVRIVQTLSRFLDHLANPELSLQIYRETGWMREARLRALLLK